MSPSDANNKGVNWNSTNTSVATIDGNGKVTCLAAGTTTITATASDGSGINSSLELTVRNPLNSLTLNKNQTTLLYGGVTTTVTATTDPSNYDASNITWTIGDTSLATISGSGKSRTITSNNTKKTGETTLTVTAGSIIKTIKISIVSFQTTTYTYTGSVQQVDLPAGTYKLECWGAQGGGSYGNGTFRAADGKGGYSIGTLTLSSITPLYIVVGGKGQDAFISTTASAQGGYNGGGNSGIDRDSDGDDGGGGGGGATHIATTNGLLKELNSNKDAVLIVAGGAGGNGFYNAYNSQGNGTSHGGGTNGIDGYGASGSGSYSGKPGTQSSGYAFGLGENGGYCQDIGGNNSVPTPGGGGGYYGGYSGNKNGGYGGGGGSGYINTTKLTSAQTMAGNKSFPSPTSNSNETGHSGNGYARITPIN